MKIPDVNQIIVLGVLGVIAYLIYRFHATGAIDPLDPFLVKEFPPFSTKEARFGGTWWIQRWWNDQLAAIQNR